MLDIPALFIATAGTAFLIASHAPAVLASRSVPAEAPRIAAVPSGKADRLTLAPKSPAAERKPVAVVEIVGTTRPTIVLRDRDGTILYRSDDLTATTLVAKDSDLPIVSVKEAREAPVAQRAPAPVVRDDGRPGPENAPRKRAIGCESAVSPLARGAGAAGFSRCLTDAGTRSLS